MRRLAAFSLAALPALTVAAAAPVAHAGCSSGCSTCCLPASHQVSVPGVSIAIPGVAVTPPSVISGVGGSVSGGVDVSVSASASAQAAGVGVAQSYAAAIGNAQAANLLAASGGGYVVEQGATGGAIPNLVVEGVAAPPQNICNAWAAVSKAVAVQASCVDDTAVPHPASQLFPERDVQPTYEGELYRCIAGARLQYVTAEWSGQARFDHGQTHVCEKGEALWRGHDGALQCRPQKPARDCNERSLLRRFGAGIKVVTASAQVCTGYGPGAPAQSVAAVGQDFSLDGGVGR